MHFIVGSSPAQASTAPVSQDKDAVVFDKRGGTQLSDPKLKEPVVMLNRIRPEVMFSLVFLK